MFSFHSIRTMVLVVVHERHFPFFHDREQDVDQGKDQQQRGGEPFPVVEYPVEALVVPTVKGVQVDQFKELFEPARGFEFFDLFVPVNDAVGHGKKPIPTMYEAASPRLTDMAWS